MRPSDLTLVLIVMVIWGLNFVVAKWGLEQFPPIFMMGLRFGLVALLLLPFVKLPKKQLRGIALLSVTLGCVHFSLMFTGLKGTDAAAAAIAIQIQVPFAALIAAVVLKDRLGWRRAGGMALAFLGIVIMAGEPRLSGNLWPLALIIAASFMWAVANVQIKQLGAVDGFALNAYLGLFAAPQLFLVSAVLENGQIEALRAADWVGWSAVLYMAVLVTIISYVMWYRVLRRYTVNQAMPFTLLVPVLGVLSAALLLDEPLTWRVILGGVATIAGVAVIVLRRPRLAEPGATAKSV
ncbi:MAG TPA: EamA family transporter [Alphaproteobacteria bacterium]|nr:EamA family transporter [Alphaproteobacteria bacterium]